MPRAKISVLLADDHTIVRQGLRLLLEAQADIEVVGEAETGRQAVELTRKLRPRIVVMDIAMPRLNGLEATRQILKLNPKTRVIILTMYTDAEYLRELIEAGAAAFLGKQTASADLVRAVREVNRGNLFFSPSISSILPLAGNPASAPSVPHENLRRHGLTSREMEILQLIAEGLSNKDMAAELAISVKTVEKHRQQLMNKLNLHRTADLTRYAIAQGITRD